MDSERTAAVGSLGLSPTMERGYGCHRVARPRYDVPALRADRDRAAPDLPGVVMVVADAATEEVVVHGEVSEDRVRVAVAEVSVLVNGACGGEEVTGG